MVRLVADLEIFFSEDKKIIYNIFIDGIYYELLKNNTYKKIKNKNSTNLFTYLFFFYNFLGSLYFF